MQDRYAGDIGDFGKIGLLRALRSQGLSVAVNWYLVEVMDSEKNADGTFKQEDGKYLIPDKLKLCDPTLAEILTGIAQSNRRSVKALEQADLIPGAVYNNEPVPVNGRSEWHHRALEKLKNADLVFVDPDNGMLVKSVGKKSVKSVKRFFLTGKSNVTGISCRANKELHGHGQLPSEGQTIVAKGKRITVGYAESSG